ncbi:hypothetical protein FQZ97_1140430 [compost metagenome]
MTSPVCRGIDSLAHAHRHVLSVQDRLHQLGRARSGVRVVAVNHHVHIRLDVGKHAAHHVPFTSETHRAHMGAGFARQRRGAVGGGIVEHIDIHTR